MLLAVKISPLFDGATPLTFLSNTVKLFNVTAKNLGGPQRPSAGSHRRSASACDRRAPPRLHREVGRRLTNVLRSGDSSCGMNGPLTTLGFRTSGLPEGSRQGLPSQMCLGTGTAMAATPSARKRASGSFSVTTIVRGSGVRKDSIRARSSRPTKLFSGLLALSQAYWKSADVMDRPSLQLMSPRRVKVNVLPSAEIVGNAVASE